MWSAHHGLPGQLRVSLRPHTRGLADPRACVIGPSGEKAANVVFETIQDRRGRSILSIRDQNTFDVRCGASA